MRKTLVIDRSTDVQSVALVIETDGVEPQVIAKSFDGIDCRSGDWVIRVREFLGGQLPDRVVVGTGPGSFAGIRAALAFAQGLALGAAIEVLGLPSACALALPDSPVAAVGDARQGKFWIALFDGLRLVTDIFQVEVDLLDKRVPQNVRVVSPDAKRIDAVLKEKFGRFYVGGAVPTAEGLAKYFLVHPDALVREPLPIYLNPAVRR